MDSTLARLTQADVPFNGQAVLSDIGLAIEPGQIATLIGPNGAGKTTLVRSVLDLFKPHVGEVWRRPRLTIGYMPQGLHVDATPLLNVLRFPHPVPGVRCEQTLATLREVGTTHVLERPLRSISDSKLQRVLLTHALLCKPEPLALDEPVQGVDVAGRAELYHLTGKSRDHYDYGILMISYDLYLVMSATNQVVCLDCHICCSGHPEQVSGDPAFVELFDQDAHSLAIYYHHRNRTHGLHGEVVKVGPDALPPGICFTPVHRHGLDCNHG